MKKHIILAGNYEQARRYMAEKILMPSQCIIARNVEDIKEIEDGEVHRTGTWLNLPIDLINEINLRVQQKEMHFA